MDDRIAPDDARPRGVWIGYNSKILFQAFPTDDLDLAIKDDPFTHGFTLSITDMQEEVGRDSVHPTVEDAMRYAADVTGLALEWRARDESAAED